MTAVNCWIFYLPSVRMRIHMLCLYPASCQTQTVPATETAQGYDRGFYIILYFTVGAANFIDQ